MPNPSESLPSVEAALADLRERFSPPKPKRLSPEAKERLRERLRRGVQPAEDSPAPYPAGTPGRIVKRADNRVRIATELVAQVGQVLIVESAADDLLEVVAAVVYAAHPEHRLLDCRLLAPFVEQPDAVLLRSTSLVQRDSTCTGVAGGSGLSGVSGRSGASGEVSR